MIVGEQPTQPHNLFRPGDKAGVLIGFLMIVVFTAACRPQPNQVFIDVDHGRQALTTEATTVREALAEARIDLGPLDRVKPDLYAQLEPGLVIVITRVREEIEVQREVVPFERQTITNEALATGETRLAQLGVNGEDEISIRVVYENGIEVSRTEISRVTIIEPVPEILVVGPQHELPSVPVEGVIAYMANGNAWLMRDTSGSRRALTTAGNLDGRVFDLSPDGRQLVYTTKLTDEIDLPLNEMWLASTTIVGEKPITTGIQGVLQAAWSPVISQSLIAYTTAERAANPPGWRANNDLWLLDLHKPQPKPVEIVPPNTQGLYAWWGTTFTWSPDGTKLAYARADQVGVIDLTAQKPVSETVAPLVNFTPLKTFSEWVWVPNLSWSPDGKFIAVTVHGPPLATEPAEESQIFDLWLFGVGSGIAARVAEQVGMWANPSWGAAGIAFGQANDPFQSVNSRYNLKLMDKDGSNKRQIFPFKEELGVQLPDMVWSPQGQELLFTYNGNLYIASSNGSPPKQLTADGQASRPRWVAEAPAISGTTTLTNISSLTTTSLITVSGIITRTPAPAVTPSIQATGVTPPISATPPVTSSPLPVASQTPSPGPARADDKVTIQATGTVTSPAGSGNKER